MTVAQPPKPWKIEQQGLANTLSFTRADYRHGLIWEGGRWYLGFMPASAIPHTTTRDEARTMGCAWLHDLESAS